MNEIYENKDKCYSTKRYKTIHDFFNVYSNIFYFIKIIYSMNNKVLLKSWPSSLNQINAKII
jgi:hypothetical protein